MALVPFATLTYVLSQAKTSPISLITPLPFGDGLGVRLFLVSIDGAIWIHKVV